MKTHFTLNVVGNKMKQTKAEILTSKTLFNSYDDNKTYPTADIKCLSCAEAISISFKDLEKHQLSEYSNLTQDTQNKIKEFVELNVKVIPNSFLDYICPKCNATVRLYYESWAGGRHGEYGYELKMVISE